MAETRAAWCSLSCYLRARSSSKSCIFSFVGFSIGLLERFESCIFPLWSLARKGHFCVRIAGLRTYSPFKRPSRLGDRARSARLESLEPWKEPCFKCSVLTLALAEHALSRCVGRGVVAQLMCRGLPDRVHSCCGLMRKLLGGERFAVGLAPDLLVSW
jgi:hypothetical protein